jgi:hypothetical protein
MLIWAELRPGKVIASFFLYVSFYFFGAGVSGSLRTALKLVEAMLDRPPEA